MNKRQRHILAQQIGQTLTRQPRVISIPLTSAMLEIEEAHLRRLEREGLFPGRISRGDGSRGYDLGEVCAWLKDFENDPR